MSGGANWAAGTPKPPKAAAPTAREVNKAAEVTGTSADAALDPSPRTKMVTQERLRLYLESDDYADREKKEIQADLLAGATVEAGAVSAKIDDGSDHTFNFRKALIDAAGRLIQAGILTGPFKDGEEYVESEVKKAARKPWQRLKVWR
jgi:hypothetical protein